SPGRLVGERLERDQRTLDDLGPGPVIFAARNPLAPPLFGFLEGFFYVGRRGQRQTGISIGKLKTRSAALDQGEFAQRSKIFTSEGNARAQHQTVGSGQRYQGSVFLARNPGHSAAVVEADYQ